MDFCFEEPMEEAPVREALKLYNRLSMAGVGLNFGTEPRPDVVHDADTVLADIVKEASNSFDTDSLGVGANLLELWVALDDIGRSVVEQVFYNITGLEFREYIERCLAETTRVSEKSGT